VWGGNAHAFFLEDETKRKNNDNNSRRESKKGEREPDHVRKGIYISLTTNKKRKNRKKRKKGAGEGREGKKEDLCGVRGSEADSSSWKEEKKTK